MSDFPRTFIAHKKAIRLERAKALLCLRLLVEGSSIRSTERITGIIGHDRTLAIVVGTHCEALLDRTIRNIPFERIEADEIWGFGQRGKAARPTKRKIPASETPTRLSALKQQRS